MPGIISPFIGSFEVAARFEADNDQDALDLIRREWGYMIFGWISVQSTMLEGFNADGSLRYSYGKDDSYTSHAHGWSTGPTSALSFYVVGIKLDSPLGKRWTFKPHLGDLSKVQGGYETSLGRFDVNWAKKDSSTLAISLSTPSTTSGSVILPIFKSNGTISIQLNNKGVKFNITPNGKWASLVDNVKGGLNSILVLIR